MCKVSKLSTSEAKFARDCAYHKAWSWANFLSFPMFSITTNSVTRARGGWIVNGTLTIPGTEIVGYSVFFKRKTSNGRLAGEPIVIIYASDLF